MNVPSGSLTGFCLDHLTICWIFGRKRTIKSSAHLFSDSAVTMQTQLSRNQKKENEINWLIKLPLNAPITDHQATLGLFLSLLFYMCCVTCKWGWHIKWNPQDLLQMGMNEKKTSTMCWFYPWNCWPIQCVSKAEQTDPAMPSCFYLK